MSTRVQYASFLFRFYRFSDCNRDGNFSRWRIEVEHIQSSKMWRFKALEEVHIFLQQSQTAEELDWIELQEVDPINLMTDIWEI